MGREMAGKPNPERPRVISTNHEQKRPCLARSDNDQSRPSVQPSPTQSKSVQPNPTEKTLKVRCSLFTNARKPREAYGRARKGQNLSQFHAQMPNSDGVRKTPGSLRKPMEGYRRLWEGRIHISQSAAESQPGTTESWPDRIIDNGTRPN